LSRDGSGAEARALPPASALPPSQEPAIPHVDATAYLAPYRRRRVRRPIRLRLTEDTYPLEPVPEQSWLPIAFRAFARLADRFPVRDALIVGTGNGLDALGAVEIFDLESLTVTDLYERSLAVARENVLAHLKEPAGLELAFHAGDLLSRVPPEARFGLVYENLPNLPADADVELELGTHSGRFFAGAELAVPEPFGDHLLALHYRCLREARPFVRARGGVLTAIGGRMPHAVAFDLHRTCGYLPALVAFDVKLQVEPELVLPGYVRAEAEQGVEFTFYAPEAIGVVAERRRSGIDGQELADAVEGDLRRLAMSAAEADARARRGRPVAHSVLMIFGERQP
jgi:methylase of polypeptide subunit release factors